MFRFAASLALTVCASAAAADDSLSEFRDIALPVGFGAREPALFAHPDGQLLMSWTEPTATGHSVKVAALGNGVWSEPGTVVDAPDLFVNWADFPSVVALADGTLAVHWLESSSNSIYAYDVKLAFSADGRTWSEPITPHLDGTPTQHGFVTLVPQGDALTALWLDGRAYDGHLVEDGATQDKMQLRTATLSARGLTSDEPLDVSTCSCCQTDAAMAGEDLLVVYRDRTATEIRDISLVALRDGTWSAPETVHGDGWEVPGCPVNGPSISAHGRSVFVAWFTGARDIPAVKVAFSDDAGATFGAPVRIDHGNPAGRVDTLLLEDGTALVSWIEWAGSNETLFLCRATAGGCAETREINVNVEKRSANFPRMAATPEAIYIAWTQPLPGGTDTIRMVRAER